MIILPIHKKAFFHGAMTLQQKEIRTPNFQNFISLSYSFQQVLFSMELYL